MNIDTVVDQVSALGVIPVDVPVYGLFWSTVHQYATRREPDLPLTRTHGALPLKDLDTLSCVALTQLTHGNQKALYLLRNLPFKSISVPTLT